MASIARGALVALVAVAFGWQFGNRERAQ